MGYKRFKRHPIDPASDGFNYEMTLPGEPMIYSIKYQVGTKTLHGQLFRNQMFRSLIKCRFKSYLNSKIPVVLLVKFYVTPLDPDICTPAKLRSEKVPAARSFELNEYLLSFQEMLFNVLYHSYKQIVKIDAEKYYSNNPRTVFKFMRWEHYEHFRINGKLYAKTKAKHKTKQMGNVQSECEGDETNEGSHSGEHEPDESTGGGSLDDSELPHADTSS